jgi:hypothetical protein
VAIETVPTERSTWINLVLRMNIPPQRKAVAFALSSFANPDGTRVFPGQGKVADMANLHETNARKHIKALVAAGMLIVVKRGGGRGGATNSYRLARPADITTLPLWLDPDMNRVEDKRYSTEEHRASALGGSVDNSTAAPVDNSEMPSAGALHSDPADEEIPSVSAINTERFEQKHRALALPDQPKTNPLPTQPPAGLRNATTSLALVPPIHNDNESIDEGESGEHAAARAVLAGIPRSRLDQLRHVAEGELLAAGLTLTREAVTIRTAQIANRQTANGAA